MKLIREMLSGRLKEKELKRVAGGFDLIGNIAILKLPEEMDCEKKKMIAEMLIDKIPSLKSVWNQIGPLEGQYRLRRLEHLAGKRETRTEYREHGVKLLVDVAGAYFSPRLSEERMRICRMVGEGEMIFNMFSGVGSYSILIAKKVENVKVYSSEINEQAYQLMVENIRLNKLSNRVYPMLGDCRDHAKLFNFSFDRAIMSLPEEAFSYLPLAAKKVKKGGIIHYYSMVRGEKKEVVEEEFRKIKGEFNNLEMISGRVVTEAGPRIYEVAIDLTSN